MNDRPPANSNRAYLLTPPGVAAIAVVRLTGPGVPAFLAKHFAGKPRSDRPVHGRLVADDRTLDDPVVVLCEDGLSVDLNLHGGTWVVRSVLDLAKIAGFDVLERLDAPLPAETTDAADALEQEILAHLPLARTELGVRTLLNQRKLWTDVLRQFVPSPGTPGEGEIATALESRGLWNLLHPPTVAIVGAANVGKSTLANQLFGQERSIAADLPGTTRDWVGEIADLDGLAVTLVDTPGLRRTDDAIETEAIRRSRQRVAAAELVIVMLDASRPMDEEQTAAMNDHPGAIIIANKCDRPAAWDVNSFAAMKVVATTGEGVDALRQMIRRHFQIDEKTPLTPACWTERQRLIVQQSHANSATLARLFSPSPDGRGKDSAMHFDIKTHA